MVEFVQVQLQLEARSRSWWNAGAASRGRSLTSQCASVEGGRGDGVRYVGGLISQGLISLVGVL